LLLAEVKGLVSAQLEEDNEDHRSEGFLPHRGKDHTVLNWLHCQGYPAEEGH
jgi:hypothetical protein